MEIIEKLSPKEFIELDYLLKEQDAHEITLEKFAKDFFQVVEPGTQLSWGWHLDAICEHLTAVSNGQIKHLLINMPPRHMKSLLTSVFWPVWSWIKKPSLKWIFSSYGQNLSTRDSLKCRRLILSPQFQKRFGHRFSLLPDQRTKTRYDNNHMGYRLATSVGGMATGEGADRIVCDDPHNVIEAESDLVREGTVTWWLEAMSTRANDPKTCAWVINMQRIKENDLSGVILEKGGYEHLCLPAEYEGVKCRTSIGWEDPREEEGELLWPSRYGREEIDDLKKKLGPYASAGQLQQRPTAREGGIIKLKWFDGKVVKDLPDFSTIIQSWDTAFKTKQENDYSVCTTWGISVIDSQKKFYLLDRYKKKLEFPELKNAIIEADKKYNPVLILIEDKASGQSLVQEMRRILPQKIKPIRPDVDKIMRANACSAALESCVYLYNEHWIQDYLHNLTIFPNGQHDDDVDSTTQALLYMNNIRTKPIKMTNYMTR